MDLHTVHFLDRADTHDEFETLFADLSCRLTNAPSSRVDGEIQDALRRVRELVGIDLSAHWRWSPAADGASG